MLPLLAWKAQGDRTMPTPRFLKDLPIPLRWLWHPWSLAALGLHVLVFSLPLAPDPTPEPELESVTIVELPPSIAPVPSPLPPLQ
ncbi:MAG: hypothetical protein HC881_09140, partial [Leptolyngbyaceae cyanobacterium SL_7_1]|nr:hypothetical protein [Leptolyngbyaceae cyanobacterium SL_7_1]